MVARRINRHLDDDFKIAEIGVAILRNVGEALEEGAVVNGLRTIEEAGEHALELETMVPDENGWSQPTGASRSSTTAARAAPCAPPSAPAVRLKWSPSRSESRSLRTQNPHVLGISLPISSDSSYTLSMARSGP